MRIVTEEQDPFMESEKDIGGRYGSISLVDRRTKEI